MWLFCLYGNICKIQDVVVWIKNILERSFWYEKSKAIIIVEFLVLTVHLLIHFW